jgi:hypothetical protein
VFTAPQGGASGDRIPGSRVAAGDPGGRPGRAAHPRPSPYRRRPVDRGRGQPQGGRGPGRARLGELHPRPVRPCTRRPTPPCATAWTPSTARPSRRRRAPSFACPSGPGVAPVWPQAPPATTRAPPMMHRRRSDLLGCGVEVRGFEPLASSVRDLYRVFSQGTALCRGPRKTVRNARSVAVDRRIGGHDPPRFSGGLPGRYGHRLLPVCCPASPTRPSGPQSESPAYIIPAA